MERFFQSLRPLIRFALRRPGLVVAVAAVLAVVGLWRASHLSVDTDLAKLLPDEYPSVQALEAIRARVGGGSPAEVAIVSPSPEANLQFAEAFLEDVLASNANDGKPFFSRVDWRRDTEFLETNALYFATEQELDELEAYLEEEIEAATLEANPFFFDLELEEDEAAEETDTGVELAETFDALIGKEYPISDDSTTVVLRFYPAEGEGNIGNAEAAFADLRAIAAALGPASFHPDMELTYAGRLQRQVVELRAITNDVASSLGAGVAAVLLFVVLYFLYKAYTARVGHRWDRSAFITELVRTPVLAAMIGLPLVMSLLWTFGVAEVVFGALNLMTTTLGLVLFGLGIDYGIHFYARYAEERGQGRTVEDAAETTFLSTGQAIAVSALTTAAALYVLTLADFRGFSEFGFIAGTGILLSLFAMLLVMPALLALAERARLLNLERTAAPVERATPVSRKAFPAARPVALVSLAAVVAALVFLPRVSFEYRFGELEPRYEEYSERNRITQRVYDDRTRRNPAYILLDDPEDAPAVVAAVREQAAADTLDDPVVRRVESLNERFPTTPQAQQQRLDRIAAIRATLDDPNVVAADIEDLPRLRRAAQTTAPLSLDDVPDFLREQFTDKTGAIGSFVIIYPMSNMSDARRSQRFADLVGRVETADGNVYYAGSTSIIAAEMLRLLQAEAPLMVGLTFGFIALLMLLVFRSLKWTLLALVPLMVGLIWMVGIIEFFSLKLNFYNLVVLPAVIGIGNDAGVHLVHRYREEGSGSVLAVLRSTGEHVAMGSLTTMIGFGGLLFSFHPGLHSIGVLAVVGIGATLAAALLFLPAALQWLEDRAVRPDEVTS